MDKLSISDVDPHMVDVIARDPRKADDVPRQQILNLLHGLTVSRLVLRHSVQPVAEVLINVIDKPRAVKPRLRVLTAVVVFIPVILQRIVGNQLPLIRRRGWHRGWCR